jgi:sugar transferase (PEP-CTERM/EpsH1 system associated)
MAKLLFLAHRVPFPPDKGDKIRAFHILEHLSKRHRIWLGAGADDAADMRHLPMARMRYGDAYFGLTHGAGRAAGMALAGLTGQPLSVARFRQPGLARWIGTVLRTVKPDLVYVYSSALAQYVAGHLPANASLIVDFVDADAEKWREYAASAPPPAGWIYNREFHSLVRYERRILRAAEAGILVSETERRLQAGFSPESAAKLHVVPNGVDTDFFRPDAAYGQADKASIVFTGTMDYPPNIDAVRWFARDILPTVRLACPDATFRIVGARPVEEVRALARLPGVIVTGTVPDIRPYIFGAAVVVAPLRIARGIQNKVLEGMAAGRPLVVTPQALDGIDAEAGRDVLVRGGAGDFAMAVVDVLTGRAPPDLGGNGRAYVLARHQWPAQLAKLDGLVNGILHRRSAQASAQDR